MFFLFFMISNAQHMISVKEVLTMKLVTKPGLLSTALFAFIANTICTLEGWQFVKKYYENWYCQKSP